MEGQGDSVGSAQWWGRKRCVGQHAGEMPEHWIRHTAGVCGNIVRLTMNRLQQKVKPQARGRMGVAGEGGKPQAEAPP